MAAGENHSFFIKRNDSLWAMGDNMDGQLGDGTTDDHLSPVQIASGVFYVAAGDDHSFFIKSDGALWAMGKNSYGQLGDGPDTDDHLSPVQIATGVAQVAAGVDHSLFVKSNGTLWAMGRNNDGQLGDGTETDRHSPVQIATGVARVAAGKWYSLFTKSDGTLWAMGNNGAGQLGDGTTDDHLSPVQIESGVSQIAAGASHSLFIKSDGTLWAMGYNYYGQLGDGTSDYHLSPVQVADGVSQIAAGQYHSLFVKSDGSLWAMGSNYTGALGDGTDTNRRTPVRIAVGAARIAAGEQYSLFIKADGTLWATGHNWQGQLGDGTDTNRLSPVQVATGVSGSSSSFEPLPDFTYAGEQGEQAILDVCVDEGDFAFTVATFEIGRRCLVSWAPKLNGEWLPLLAFDVTTQGIRIIDSINLPSKLIRTKYLPPGVREANHFDYPIGNRGYDSEGNPEPIDERITSSPTNQYFPNNPTQSPERVGEYSSTDWYNYQDVGSYNSTYGGIHPGEDWNKGSAGSDIGESVFAVANGIIETIQPANNSAGLAAWGWSVVIRHWLPNGESVCSIYVHVAPDQISGSANTNGLMGAESDFSSQEGSAVTNGQQIAVFGDIPAGAHLHLEMRDGKMKIDSNLWPNSTGDGYYGSEPGVAGNCSPPMTSSNVAVAFSLMKQDAIIFDASDFIDSHR